MFSTRASVHGTPGVVEQRNQDATVFVRDVDDRADEELLKELCSQAGVVAAVRMPRDRVSQLHQNYAFVEFRTEEDAEYAVKVLNMVRLYGKLLRVSKAAADKPGVVEGVGANLFIGNLSPEVDEKVLHDTFAAFGAMIAPPTIARDPATAAPRGFGFVKYDSFEAGDLAIECMNGQDLAGRPVSVM